MPLGSLKTLNQTYKYCSLGLMGVQHPVGAGEAFPVHCLTEGDGAVG